jgi:hypothetical protein
VNSFSALKALPRRQHLGEMVETDNWHMSKVLQLRRLETPMARENHVGVIDEHRV